MEVVASTCTLSLTIVSGGQSGADRAALDWARTHGLVYRGWIPAGGAAEDLATGRSLQEEYPLLTETPLSDPAQRTEWNVRDSDATLIVRGVGESSPGTDLTERVAVRLRRPVLNTDGSDPDVALNWLSGLGETIALNVAGPRESEAPGSYARCTELLDRVLGPFTNPAN